MPNLRGASPVGRDEGGQSYVARAGSKEETSRRRGGSGKNPCDVVRGCRRGGHSLGQSHELVQYHESSRMDTLRRGITAVDRAKDAQEVGRPGAF